MFNLNALEKQFYIDSNLNTSYVNVQHWHEMSLFVVGKGFKYI